MIVPLTQHYVTPGTSAADDRAIGVSVLIQNTIEIIATLGAAYCSANKLRICHINS